MELVNLIWDPNGGYRGRDVHLIRGGVDSLDLRPQLVMVFEPTSADPPTATGQRIFASQLATNPALAALVVGGVGGVTFSPVFPVQAKHGFTFAPASGVVSAPLNPPAPVVNNFVVRATATPVAAGATPIVVMIRFHLHSSIIANGVVLSPQTLTVRGGGQPQRLGVLAQFNDGVVGDVSSHPGIAWTLFTKNAAGGLVPVPPNPATGDYTSGTVTLTAGGAITATGPSATQFTVRASVALNVPTVSVDGDADLSAQGSWNDQLNVRFVDGAGVSRVNQVPNVLVLGDGFVAAERGVFDELVDRIVQEIRFSTTGAPFSDLLRKRSINFFAGSVASPQSGCSLEYELGPISATLMRSVPTPDDPGTGDVTELSQLIYGVGMPVLADATAPQNTITSRWTTLFPDFMTKVTTLTIQKLIGRWMALGNRSLAVGRNSAYGMAVGDRPNAEGDQKALIALGRSRVNIDDLERHVGTAVVTEAGTSTAIGNVWALNGKDRNFVFVLSAGLPNSGNNRTQSDRRTIGIGLGAQISPVAVKPLPGSTRVLQLDPGPLSPEPFEVTVGTMLHELAHSIECGDEYGFSLEAPKRNLLTDTKNFSNVILNASVRDAGGAFQMSQSMWGLLPRVRAAGVLVQSPQAVGANFRIRLGAGQRSQFDAAGVQVNEPLYLRVRPMMARLTTQQAQPNVAPNFTLLQSPRLRFVGNDTAVADAILVRVEGGAALPGTWNVPDPAAAFRPILLAPALGQAGQELTLISPPVAAQIRALGRPSNRGAGVGCHSPAEETAFEISVRTKVLPVNLPQAIFDAKIRNLASVLGLYDGGINQACGVYHPAGYCRMRGATDLEVASRKPGFERHHRTGSLVPYCHVCQYIIVDFVDPTLHATIDGRYKALYAE